jgi:hypothetical protein
MKYVELKAVHGHECILADNDMVYISSLRMFCAIGENGQGPCNGDSGMNLSFVRHSRDLLTFS